MENRTYKFRAWDKISKQMLTVTSIVWQVVENPNISDYIEGLDGENNYYKVGMKDCELMQNTGLKDRNEKMIYEGDIIKWGEKIGRIIWDENICRFNIRNFFNWQFETYNMEIIGNVFENKNLLQETK